MKTSRGHVAALEEMGGGGGGRRGAPAVERHTRGGGKGGVDDGGDGREVEVGREGKLHGSRCSWFVFC